MRKFYVFLLFIAFFAGCAKEPSIKTEGGNNVSITLSDQVTLIIPQGEEGAPSVSFTQSEKASLPQDLINAEVISPQYEVAISNEYLSNVKDGRLEFVVKGYKPTGFEFFIVTFNGDYKNPWIAKAQYNEKDATFRFYIDQSVVQFYLKNTKSEVLKIQFLLVENPERNDAKFDNGFFLIKYINGTYTLLNPITPPSGQKPVIFIHGWQFPIFSGNITDYIKGASETIVRALTESGFENKFEFYGFGYDPDYDIYQYSAYALNYYINRYLAYCDTIYIIAHSMGGIVARAYVKWYKPSSKVVKVITLGTPHHGTPLTNFAFGGYIVPILVPINPWLKWDNLYWTWAMYPVFFFFDGNPYLDALNYNYREWSRTYAFSGYGLSGDHPLYITSGSYFLSFNGFGDNDGVVPLSSSRADNYNPIRYYFPDVDHIQLHENPVVINYIKALLK